MNGQPQAILFAVEATRSHLHEPPGEPSPARPRRATARLLAALAVRLDPALRPRLS